MTLDDFVGELVREFALEATPDPTSRLHDDLGFDSLALFLLVLMIEERSGCTGNLDEYPRLETVQDAYEYFERSRGLTR